MKTLYSITIFLFLISMPISAQIDLSVQAEIIENEGKMLYYSEKASWHGSDIFKAKYENPKNVAGYLSYPYMDSVKCIFFSKPPMQKVVFAASFSKAFDLNNVNISMEERNFTMEELDLYTMREKAINTINNDTIFKHYQNTNLNIIPIINGETKRVYILTGPSASGVVIFGNDYLIRFNSKNEVVSINELHNNLIPIEYSKDSSKEVVSTMHSHLPETGEFITPTDICTLMLYQSYANWQTHYVISKNYVSMWDCKTNQLTIITREAFDKISSPQDE